MEAEDQAAATTAKTAVHGSVPAAADDAAASAASASASAAAAPNPLLTAAAPPPPLPPPPPPPPRPAAEARPFAASNQGEKETAVRWASLLSSARAEAQAAFLLKRVGACPRCCLRFAGVRDAAAYAPPAPSSAALLAELTGSEEEGEEEEEEEKGKSSEEGGGPRAPCASACSRAPSRRSASLCPRRGWRRRRPRWTWAPGRGPPWSGGTGERVAAVVERQGHSSPPSAPPCSSAPPPPCSSAPPPPSSSAPPPPSSPRVVSLQVSFPASVGLRQAAASAALAAAGLPAAKPRAPADRLPGTRLDHRRQGRRQGRRRPLSVVCARGRRQDHDRQRRPGVADGLAPVRPPCDGAGGRAVPGTGGGQEEPAGR